MQLPNKDTKTTEDPIDAHPAALSELPRVISALERAFFHDRVYRWTVPGQQLVADEDAASFGRSLVEAAGDDAGGARMAQVLGLLDEQLTVSDCPPFYAVWREPAG